MADSITSIPTTLLLKFGAWTVHMAFAASTGHLYDAAPPASIRSQRDAALSRAFSKLILTRELQLHRCCK